MDITFTVSGTRGYLMGSEVSDALMTLTVVEFSFYMGFPVLQIAERELLETSLTHFTETVLNRNKKDFSSPTAFHYPELNTSQLLRSTWVRTGKVLHAV